MAVNKVDYSGTLNLPKTGFPMRANLAKKEPEILGFWEEIGLYNLVQEKTRGKPKFILHDGPPYANGDIHLGTALNKILKDMVVKYFSLRNYDTPFVPGWDTHGLPIEHQVIKNLGLDRHELGAAEFRRRCRDYALKFVDVQRQQFKRLGVRGDWEHPYLTLDPGFEAEQIGVFGEMARKGYIYKGLKPVYWCPECETALAEAEVEYGEKQSPSIYVAFVVKDGKGVLEAGDEMVIWTTTPWTLPANVAVACHPDERYVVVRFTDRRFVVARPLMSRFLAEVEMEGAEQGAEFYGRELEGVVLFHPFLDRESVVISGTHVTMEQGTGLVHTAPGHGLEDYEVGRKYGLPVLSPLDDRGVFTGEAGPFEGLRYEDANRAIIDRLNALGRLLKADEVWHQYPHCWRCKNPVIFRATEQWFASVDGFRKAALHAVRSVRWIPAWGEERISSMIRERSDWCISRQRVWGVPIPAFYCENCGQVLLRDEVISHVQNLIRKHGSDVWFVNDAHELVPLGVRCGSCGHTGFRKETDIMDVWFDSGSSHVAVLETRPELRWPADLYLEGSDQHRGWFNSSLSTAVATRGEAPYRMVLTHGYVVDEQGRKMSKSLGNGIDPLEAVEQLGADVLRLWVAASDYKKDVAASYNILRQAAEVYRKIRNTFRFLLGNLYDFVPGTDDVEYKAMPELDRYMLHRLHKVLEQITAAYDRFEFHVAYRAIHDFCVLELSAFYLDVIKDRLYVLESTNPLRRSAQTVLYEVARVLLVVLVPMLAFTTEEIWQYLPKGGDEPVSVQLLDWPEVNRSYLDEELGQKWEALLEVRDKVTKALEIARQQKLIGSSLEAEVDLYPGPGRYELLKSAEKELAMLFITSSARVHPPEELPPEGTVDWPDYPGLKVLVSRARGIKCQRCWMYTEDVGQDPVYTDVCARCAAILRAS